MRYWWLVLLLPSLLAAQSPRATALGVVATGLLAIDGVTTIRNLRRGAREQNVLLGPYPSGTRVAGYQIAVAVALWSTATRLSPPWQYALWCGAITVELYAVTENLKRR